MTALMNYRELRQMAEKMEPGEVVAHITEALAKKELTPQDFSLRQLFEATVPSGREIIESWNPRNGGVATVMEAGVESGLFKNISGQLLFSAMLERYQSPNFVWNKIARVVPTQFDGEKIPGLTSLGDDGDVVKEGREYPRAAISETWIETPQTTKRGIIVEVTKEAVFFDRTNMVLEQAREVGFSLGLGLEKEVLDAAMGVNSTWNPLGRGALSTYSNSTGLHDFDNLINSNEMADYTDFQNALAAFRSVTDPGTGEPIDIVPNQVLCTWAVSLVARRILQAQQIVTDPNSNTGTAKTVTYYSPSTVIPQQFDLLTNPWVESRMSAGSVNTTSWFVGDFQRGIWYMENWPITVVQDDGGDTNFTRDVVARFKASRRGKTVVVNPRYIQKNTAES